ncbi:hypothetical protein TrCOL_g3416 [Triparma columacea]|nr:hypothetical protein TrCOL_g3416 [Triparma columacea]
MCRNIDRGRKVLREPMKAGPGLVTLVKGDVTDTESLRNAIMGTRAVLLLHGTLHPTPIHALLLPIYWSTHAPLTLGASKSHPYFTNYIAMQDVVSCCEKYGVERVVRLTGLSCGLSPWNPVSVLFNALLSFSGRYHRLGEEVLRSSGSVQAVVLRPGGLSDGVRDGEKTRVQLDLACEIPPPARVGRADVADAAVLAGVDGSGLISGVGEHVTAAVRWVGDVEPRGQGNLEEGEKTVGEAWRKAVERGGGRGTEKRQGGWKFALAHGIYVYGLLAAVVKIALKVGGLGMRLAGF